MIKICFMWYIDMKGNVFNTEDADKINLWGFLSELRLYKGENPLYTMRGVDYIGVLNGEVFLKDTVENCSKRYTNAFKNISLGEVTQKKEIVSMAIKVTQFSGETNEMTVGVGTNGNNS